jgi:intracellular septation protein
MKIFLDFFPVALFFIAFKLWGIWTATAVAIVATVAQIFWVWRTQGKVHPMQWVSLGIIVVFGGASILTHDETFIKLKPTVLYGLMGTALIVGKWVFHRNFLQQLMREQISVPDFVWNQLLHAWAVFFAAMALLNLWVASHFDTDTWVSFKLFGTMGLTLVFIIVQAVYLGRHVQTDPSES